MKKETLYVLSCYCIWGVFPLFWNLLTDVDAMCLLGWRGLFSMAVVLALIGYYKDWDLLWKTLKNPKLTAHIALAGILIYLNWGLYIWCTTSEHRLDASLAYFMTPMMSILIGMLFFKERMNGRQWFAVGITLFGVGYVLVSAGEVPWMALVLGGSFAVYGAIKKPLKLPYQIVMAVETLTIAPVSIAVLLWCSNAGTHPDYSAMGWRLALLPISGVVTIIPLVLFARGIAKTSMTLTGVLMYISPTLQMVMALILGERLTGDNVVLFCFVWVGLLVYLVPEIWGLYRQKESLHESH